MKTHDQEFRLECLKLAVTSNGGSPKDVLDCASNFYDFVTGMEKDTDYGEGEGEGEEKGDGKEIFFEDEEPQQEDRPEERQFLDKEAGFVEGPDILSTGRYGAGDRP